MTIQNQQERSLLNDGIETDYMFTADYAGNIQTFYEIKRGTLKDEYEGFFRFFARLVQLVECLEELSKEKEVLESVHHFINNPAKDTNLDNRCAEGIETFKKLKKAMSARGLLALPSKGR